MAVDSPFIKFIGKAVESDVERCLVDEGDQASETLEGWAMVDIQDAGNQITDGEYYIPFYSLE